MPALRRNTQSQKNKKSDYQPSNKSKSPVKILTVLCYTEQRDSSSSATKHWKWNSLTLGSSRLARRRCRLPNTQELGHQLVSFGMRSSAAGFEMQSGLAGHVGHEVLRVVTHAVATQGHDLHEGVGGFVDGGLVVGSVLRLTDGVHRVLVHKG